MDKKEGFKFGFILALLFSLGCLAGKIELMDLFYGAIYTIHLDLFFKSVNIKL